MSGYEDTVDFYTSPDCTRTATPNAPVQRFTSERLTLSPLKHARRNGQEGEFGRGLLLLLHVLRRGAAFLHGLGRRAWAQWVGDCKVMH